MSYINWNIKTQDLSVVKSLSKQLNCTDTVSVLLYNRGITDAQQAKAFLNPSDSLVHNPYLLNDMQKAVDSIKEYIAQNKKICIYGDYDVDGITSTSVLYLYLKRFTENVGYFIPDRFSEGYGINNEAIDKIKNDGYQVIITVDTGISALNEIEYANSLGIDVIITDHHECQEALPRAVAIINPKRKDSTYPFDKLAGVGVVYKLVCALDVIFNTSFANDYIDLVAVGTIADIMPLLDENRYIVKQGIEKISNSPNFGLKCLIDLCVSNFPVNSGSIGYAVAPRINAAGRMADAEIAVNLFTTNQIDIAKQIANTLCELNVERQQIENQIIIEAEQIIKEHKLNERYSVLVLWNEGWHSGIIGIVASKLKEKYNKPVILFSVDKYAKGSGRSVAPFNLYNAFEENKDMLIQYGGHKYAAGVLVDNDKLFEFRDKISKAVDKFLTTSTFTTDIDVECVLPPSDVSIKTVNEISLLQPFGKQNEIPLFCLRNVKINELFPIANNKHLRIRFSIGAKNITAFYFSVDMQKFDYREGDLVDIVCELNENEYKNHKSVQLVIKDLRYNLDVINSYSERRNSCDNFNSVLKTHLPTRADIAVVYRFFYHTFSKGRNTFNLDTISNIINKDCLVSLNYEKVYYSIKILLDLGVITGNVIHSEFVISDIPEGKKFSLKDSKVLNSIYDKAGVSFGN